MNAVHAVARLTSLPINRPARLGAARSPSAQRIFETQLVDGRPILGGQVHQAFGGIHGAAAPVRSASRAGREIVSVSPGGVNRPSLRMLAIRSFHRARSSGVRMYGFTSSGVIFCRAKGG